MTLFSELQRRNVLRVGAAYLVTSWLLIQVAETLFPLFGYGDTPARIVVIVLAIGFIPTLVLAWAFELTPQGLKRERDVVREQSIAPRVGKTLDRFIMAALALALAYFAFDKFVLDPRREAALVERQAAQVEQARQEGRSEALIDSYGDKSIAVLPFVNTSAEAEQEYFSDGISEELLSLLARIPGLRVISRSSAFSFKGQNLEVPEIARRLKVAHVLEGSVRKSGDRVRITAQLVEARSDTQLWSQSWDRTLGDIFAIQDEIAGEVARALQITLLGAAPRARTTDPQAYAYYLQAVQLGRQFTAEALERSDALHRQALAIDPDYAPAWSELARNLVNATNLGLLSIEDGYARARAAAEQALGIDPDYAPAHARLGTLAMVDHDLTGAARHYQRALELDPTDPGVLGSAAILLQSLGRLPEALVLQEAIALRDPVDVTALYSLGNAQLWAGRLAEAIASYRTVLSLSPGRGGAHCGIAIALLLEGDAAGALEEIGQETSDSWRMICLPMAYHALGRKEDSDTALAALVAKYERDAAYNIAYVHAFRGEADAAFAWLDKAVAYGDGGLPEIVAENLFANIHDDPRWEPFLRSLGFAPEQLAAIRFEVTPPAEQGG